MDSLQYLKDFRDCRLESALQSNWDATTRRAKEQACSKKSKSAKCKKVAR